MISFLFPVFSSDLWGCETTMAYPWIFVVFHCDKRFFFSMFTTLRIVISMPICWQFSLRLIIFTLEKYRIQKQELNTLVQEKEKLMYACTCTHLCVSRVYTKWVKLTDNHARGRRKSFHMWYDLFLWNCTTYLLVFLLLLEIEAHKRK